MFLVFKLALFLPLALTRCFTVIPPLGNINQCSCVFVTIRGFMTMCHTHNFHNFTQFPTSYSVATKYIARKTLSIVGSQIKGNLHQKNLLCFKDMSGRSRNWLQFFDLSRSVLGIFWAPQSQMTCTPHHFDHKYKI